MPESTSLAATKFIGFPIIVEIFTLLYNISQGYSKHFLVNSFLSVRPKPRIKLRFRET